MNRRLAVRGPAACHVDGGFAVRPVLRAPGGLAVDRRDVPFGGFPAPVCPFNEDVLEIPRAHKGKDAPKGVARWI